MLFVQYEVVASISLTRRKETGFPTGEAFAQCIVNTGEKLCVAYSLPKSNSRCPHFRTVFWMIAGQRILVTTNSIQ